MGIAVALIIIALLGYFLYVYMFKNANQYSQPPAGTDISSTDRSHHYSDKSANSQISVRLEVREKTEEEQNANELLKEATRHYEKRDYESAIDCLRRSYVVLKASPTSYPISTYTRLPSYLVRSGKYEEGIAEAKNLIAWIPERTARDFGHCKPNQRKGIACNETSQVYHTMSFLSGLAKKWQNALLFEVTSHAFACLSLKYYPKGQERRSKQSRSAWREKLQKPIAKGGYEQCQDMIFDACIFFCKDCTEEAIAVLSEKVKALTSTPLEPVAKNDSNKMAHDDMDNAFARVNELINIVMDTPEPIDDSMLTYFDELLQLLTNLTEIEAKGAFEAEPSAKEMLETFKKGRDSAMLSLVKQRCEVFFKSANENSERKVIETQLEELIQYSTALANQAYQRNTLDGVVAALESGLHKWRAMPMGILPPDFYGAVHKYLN